MDGPEPDMVSQLLDQRVTHEFDSQRFGAVGNLDPKDSDPLNRIFTGFPTSYSNELLKRQRLVDSLVKGSDCRGSEDGSNGRI